MKKTIIKLLSEIFDNNMIITGTYALNEYFPVKQEDIHDLDILISDHEINREKIKSLKRIFKIVKEDTYFDSPSYHFEILGEKINLILKKPRDYEKMEVIEIDTTLYQTVASILHTKAEYGRKKDFQFFIVYSHYVRTAIKEDMNKKFKIDFFNL